MEQLESLGLQPMEGSQQTYDFSAMFPTDLEELRTGMEKLTNRVFDRQISKGVKKKKERGKEKMLVGHRSKPAELIVKPQGVKNDGQSKFYLTRERLMRWTKFLLKELFVIVGDKNMQQMIGIPMGTNSAPFLANLLLFVYELEFFEKFVQDIDFANDPEAKDFMSRIACCTRYIDDLWTPTVEASVFQEATAKMYPDWLKLGKPECEGAVVNYLDMSIWNEGSKWHSKLFDKRVDLVKKGLKLNKFPHPESELSLKCKLGIITSQMSRFEVTCTKTKDFLKAAVGFTRSSSTKGTRSSSQQILQEIYSAQQNRPSASPRCGSKKS